MQRYECDIGGRCGGRIELEIPALSKGAPPLPPAGRSGHKSAASYALDKKGDKFVNLL